MNPFNVKRNEIIVKLYSRFKPISRFSPTSRVSPISRFSPIGATSAFDLMQLM